MHRVILRSALLAVVVTLFSFSFIFPAAVLAVDPNEVIAYEHVNFVGASRSWKLTPDMRQRNVEFIGSDFNDIISSVQVGSDVEAVFFEDANWGGHNYGFYKGNLNELGGGGNDCFTSLIIVPKGKHIFGVSLDEYTPNTILGGGLYPDAQFFPIPQFKKDTQAYYEAVNGAMNDKAVFMQMFGDMEVTLYEHGHYGGQSLTLPGADKSIKQFYLNQYGFDGRVSSVVVKVAGPSPTPGAPAAPGTPNIAGNWMGSTGLTYTITQNNTTFTWTTSNGETGSGNTNGTNINASWKGTFSAGSAAGTIILNSMGAPTKINWNNGVIFSK